MDHRPGRCPQRLPRREERSFGFRFDYFGLPGWRPLNRRHFTDKVYRRMRLITALFRATAVAAVSKLSEGPKWAAPFFKPRNCRGAPQCGTARVGEGKAPIDRDRQHPGHQPNMIPCAASGVSPTVHGTPPLWVISWAVCPGFDSKQHGARIVVRLH